VFSILTASQGKNYIIFFLFSGKAEKRIITRCTHTENIF
jgi:hypothetical protein